MTGGGVLVGSLQSTVIYSRGATIDDNGQAVAIDQSLQAPTGSGIAAIPVASGGAGYVMPPRVQISGGGGSNATACILATPPFRAGHWRWGRLVSGPAAR